MSFVAGQSSVFVKAPTRANGFKRRRYSEAEKRKKSVFLPRKHRHWRNTDERGGRVPEAHEKVRRPVAVRLTFSSLVSEAAHYAPSVHV
ncbi:hypothetical protein AYO27_17275 [Rhizobium sp. GHKF11]|jgi:hypothetical protein|nr:hypothetical protein AYO27_17275 [Rhizobium sp. GHKF11]